MTTADEQLLNGRPPGSSPADGGNRWIVLGLLSMAQLLVVLDATIVNIGLPSIQRDLGFSETDLQWVINAYVLTFGGLLLLGGRMADLFGRRSTFLAGVVLFVAASATCGLADSQLMLVSGRAVQGVGAALMSPAALSIIVVSFTGAERNLALGVWGGISGVAGAAGVLLGGALTDGPGWEWVFFINVPLGLVVAALSLRFVTAHLAEDRGASLDVPGAVTVTSGLGLLVFGIVRTDVEGWGSAPTVACLAGSVVLLAGFVAIEARHPHPLVPLSVFRLANLRAGNVVSLLLGGVLFSTFFFMTLYLQQVLGYGPLKAGLAYLPLTAAIVLASGVASNVVARAGYRPLLVAGMVLLAVGALWLAQLDADGGYVPNVLWPSLVWGAGLGVAVVLSVLVATDDLGGEGESGLASGLVNTTQQVGGALGLAVLTTIAFERVDRHMVQAHGDPQAIKEALVDGFGLAFSVSAGVAALGALVAVAAVRPSRSSRTTEPEHELEHDAEVVR